MKLVIFGDSHTNTLRSGWTQAEADGRLPDWDVKIFGTKGSELLVPFFDEYPGRIELRMSLAAPEDCIIPLDSAESRETVFGIHGFFNSVRLWRNAQWRDYAPLKVATDQMPVSDALVRQIVLDEQHYMLALLDIMLKWKLKVFAIEAPGIFDHHPAFLRQRDVARAVDGIYRDTMRRELENRKVALVPIPPSTVDGDGMMKPQFRQTRERDFHHANAAYGALAARQIARFVRRKFGPKPNG
jgi:hypothetical protein